MSTFASRNGTFVNDSQTSVIKYSLIRFDSANVGIIFIPAIALTNVNYLIIVVTFKSSICVSGFLLVIMNSLYFTFFNLHHKKRFRCSILSSSKLSRTVTLPANMLGGSIQPLTSTHFEAKFKHFNVSVTKLSRIIILSRSEPENTLSVDV